MPYEQRYVAFVDILGFKDIIRRSEGNERMIKGLREALGLMGQRNTDLERALGVDFRALNFSDSVLMSEAESPKGLSHLFYQIQELALSLLSKGILLRGGIAKGSLYHAQSTVFGPALLEAYRLEVGVADFPRVVLNKAVFQDVERYKTEDDRWKYDFERDLKRADDGPTFVHVLKRFERLKADPELSDADEIAHAQLCQSALQGLVNESMHEPLHFRKVKWFAVYWNGTLGSGGANAVPGPVSFPYMSK